MSNKIDRIKFERMQSILKDNFAPTLKNFLSDVEKYIAEMSQYNATGALSDVQSVAHKLKTSSGLFGFDVIHSISQRIEKEVIASEEISILLKQLQDELLHVKKVLTNL